MMYIICLPPCAKIMKSPLTSQAHTIVAWPFPGITKKDMLTSPCLDTSWMLWKKSSTSPIKNTACPSQMDNPCLWPKNTICSTTIYTTSPWCQGHKAHPINQWHIPVLWTRYRPMHLTCNQWNLHTIGPTYRRNQCKIYHAHGLCTHTTKRNQQILRKWYATPC